jgi:predicted nucleotide-binding protein
LNQQLQFLAILLARLDLYSENNSHLDDKSRKQASISKRIFIIHGHDTALTEATARLVQVIGLEPVILHEQPNAGRTIIEKFEKYADVGFAIALFTPDDYGGSVDSLEADGRTLRPAAAHEQRARQNVVGETFYFCAKIRRERVVILRKGNVSIPSDLSGVVYHPVDDGGMWRLKLAHELANADYKVDLSKVK